MAGRDVGMAGRDAFEYRYMRRLKAQLAERGVVLDYDHDRAAIDTGLHVFVEADTDREVATQSRVWFQAKGIRRTSLSLEDFQGSEEAKVRLETHHLRFWYAFPEPVYLAVYIESADLFLAEDVSDLIERTWPRGRFYETVFDHETVTVSLSTSSVLNEAVLEAMLRHRSMRIDGPAFRGRPLGHRFDPIRSVIATQDPATWRALVEQLLSVHDFHPDPPEEISEDLTIVWGRLHQTLSWQSPAFASYGYRDHPGEYRDDPPYETFQGEVCLVLDERRDRTAFTTDEEHVLTGSIARDRPVLAFMNGRDLSSTGGLWRSFLRDLTPPVRRSTHVGREAITFLMLTTTLVYLDLVPQIEWADVNYLDQRRHRPKPLQLWPGGDQSRP